MGAMFYLTIVVYVLVFVLVAFFYRSLFRVSQKGGSRSHTCEGKRKETPTTARAISNADGFAEKDAPAKVGAGSHLSKQI